MKTSSQIGESLFRPVVLRKNEMILRDSLAQYVRSYFVSWLGRLYLTNQRIVWTPFAISFVCKPISLDKSESLNAVTSSNIIDKLGGLWRIETPSGTHLFSPVPYPFLSRKGTQQWVDAINQWANS